MDYTGNYSPDSSHRVSERQMGRHTNTQTDADINTVQKLHWFKACSCIYHERFIILPWSIACLDVLILGWMQHSRNRGPHGFQQQNSSTHSHGKFAFSLFLSSKRLLLQMFSKQSKEKLFKNNWKVLIFHFKLIFPRDEENQQINCSLNES